MNRRTALLASVGVLGGSVLSAQVTDLASATHTRESMQKVIRDLAANIVEHVAHEDVRVKLGAGHAAELDVVSMVEEILIATLRHQGFVRMQRVTDK